jgi:predicted Zn-dependent protease with MMP-like domain
MATPQTAKPEGCNVSDCRENVNLDEAVAMPNWRQSRRIAGFCMIPWVVPAGASENRYPPAGQVPKNRLGHAFPDHAKTGGMWSSATAPSLAEMEAMAHEILERLPDNFRTLCGGVIIRVDDFPTDEVLDEMQAESEFDLLGLFQGVGLPFQSNDDVARLPNMIWLYRRPILEYWAEHEETLGHIVRHVLIHEIGHHFGLSDADMEAIEAGTAE